jgi:acyl carrier protein
MATKQELLTSLQQVINEQLGVGQEEISENSTWLQLGADSLDRLWMSLAIWDEFKVEIPHQVGEQLNTVGETVDHLLSQIAGGMETSSFRI